MSIDQPPGIRARIDALSLNIRLATRPCDAMGPGGNDLGRQRYRPRPRSCICTALDRKLGRDPDPEVKPRCLTTI